jgi:hypothetical protein
MTALATIDQLEQIGASLARFGIAGHVGSYCEGAIDRPRGTLTATEADQIIEILRGQATS